MRTRRTAFRGGVALAVYLTAAVASPAAHLLNHAAAHSHAAVELPGAAADLIALGLEDVGAPAAVDCSLADLTLVDCETPSHGTRHFGDEGAREPNEPAFDPRHGIGSAEHLGVSVLAEQIYVLPAPLWHEAPNVVVSAPRLNSLDIALTHDSRGPPLFLI